VTVRATAVILDHGHRCLLVDGALPEVEVPAGVRPLVALRGAELGVTLEGPIGGTPDGATFLFLVGTSDARFAGPAQWTSLGAAWSLYVDAMLGGWKPPTRALEVFAFGNTPALAAKLAHLIVKGSKRATTAAIAVAERLGWSLPDPGTVSIVTDGFGLAMCAVRTSRVVRCRFDEAGDEIARAEGEGDGTHADWRETHARYFTAEAAALGLTFDDASPIFCEYFELVTVFGANRA
jgi:uncharacterized protein YhfF